MDCEKIRELLTAYQDGVLPANEAAEIKTHLLGCQGCQTEERLLKETWNMLNVLEPIEPSPDFRARFWERVREEERKTSWLSFPRLVPVMAGVLGVWVVGVGLGSYLFFRSPRSQMASTTSIQQKGFFDDASSLGKAYLKRMT